MATLIFLLTFLSLFVLAIITLVKIIGRKPAKGPLKVIGYILSGYLVLWVIFKIASNTVPVPFGTEVCFDDWCATVTAVDEGAGVKTRFASLTADSTWIIVYIRTSNHARGIAQKPSEPRVHILDEKGNASPFSTRGQQLLEKTSGVQPGIDHKLELHQSLQTQLVFAVPKGASGLKVLIEEGPPIINAMLPAEDKSVFLIN